MILRLSKCGLRFRLSQEEFRDFQRNRSLEEVIEIPNGPRLVFRLVLGLSSGFRVTAGLYELTVTEEELRVFAAERMTRKTKFSVDIADQFSVVLEIDVFSESRRAGSIKETQSQ